MSDDVSSLPAPVEGMGDDDVLSFTQRHRKNLVDEITREGLPKDKGDRIVLLTALGDMDRTALGNKKIGSKEKTSMADRMAALAIAKIAGQFGGQSPFEAQPGTAASVAPRRGPVTLKDDGLGELTLAPGETEVGVSDIGFDEFMSMMETTRKPKS